MWRISPVSRMSVCIAAGFKGMYSSWLQANVNSFKRKKVSRKAMNLRSMIFQTLKNYDLQIVILIVSLSRCTSGQNNFVMKDRHL